MRTITVPPSKSIAHRAVICASLAAGESRISPISLSEDVKATCRCMEALGAVIRFEQREEKEGKAVADDAGMGALIVQGSKGRDVLPEEPLLLDCGESGSTLRFLLPIVLLRQTKVRFAGSKRLMERPLGPYLEILKANGASIEYIENHIEGEDVAGDGRILEAQGPILPGRYLLPGDVSSQYVSGLLFALPLLAEDSEIELTTALESAAYVDLTIQTMQRFGVHVEKIGETAFRIPGSQSYQPSKETIEADFSNAAFFLVAGALGEEVECAGLNPNSKQGDKEILSLLEQCGAEIEYRRPSLAKEAEKQESFSENAIIRVRPSDKESKALTIDVSQIPDLVPILSVLLCFCKGKSRIINAGRLRIKESDRLHAMTEELKRLGAKVEEGSDYLNIEGVEHLNGGTCDSHNDHRIAMALAIAAYKSNGIVTIKGASCVNKSYPSFWKDIGESERVVKS